MEGTLQSRIDAQSNEWLRGIQDRLLNEKPLLTEQEVVAALNQFQTEMKMTHARSAKIVAQENKSKGEAFPAENGKKDGVTNSRAGSSMQFLKKGRVESRVKQILFRPITGARSSTERNSTVRVDPSKPQL
jgi:FKBP-type peptidyl-prolyl cis-trans isomerase FklB